MKMFLLSCLAVAAIAVAAYFGLEKGLEENAGDAFAVAGSTRVPEAGKPDPRGYLSSVHQPAGGVTSGRDPSGLAAPGAGTTDTRPVPASN